MQKLLLFLLLACLSPALVGKPLALPTDTINNHQIYLNKKPLLFANANMKKEELTISLAKKNLKNTDRFEVVYGTCTRSYEKHQLSLKNAQGKTVWETSTQTHTYTQIPIDVLLQSKEKEVSLYFGKVFLAKITLR